MVPRQRLDGADDLLVGFRLQDITAGAGMQHVANFALPVVQT